MTARVESRRGVQEARARAREKGQPGPAPIALEKKAPQERGPSPFAKFMEARAARKPDWSRDGFEKACEDWLAFAAKKDWHLMEELLEFLANKIAGQLRQRDVHCLWIASDKVDGRPYVKITLADRWVYYHDVAITIPS